jgi:glycosyltransferase involved in cell wall biosynthesis
LDCKLSILLPTLPTRTDFYSRIFDQLCCQISKYERSSAVEILTDDATNISIGVKRNRLLQRAIGKYLSFVDDDDRISNDYLELILAGIATNPDCCSLNGIITTDGKNPKPFKHSIDYKEMYEQDGVYYRPPNHLNTVRSDIAKKMVFPDWDRSEDSNYCFQLRDSGLLKVEYKIESVLYYYDYVSDKKY